MKLPDRINNDSECWIPGTEEAEDFFLLINDA